MSEGLVIPFESRLDRSDRVRRETLVDESRDVLRMMTETLGDNVAVAMVLFDKADESCVMLSNSDRPALVKALRSWLAKLEGSSA